MRKGCLLGCVGLTFLVLLSAITLFGIAYVLDRQLGVFMPTARVPLTSFYGESHAVTIFIDPDQHHVLSLAGEALHGNPWLIDFFLPHEAMAYIDVDRDAGLKKMTMAVSMKRLGGLLSWYLPIPEDWNIGHRFKVREISIQQNGVLSLSAEAPLEKEVLARASKRWPKTTEPSMVLARGHGLEVLLDNTDGKAFLALEYAMREDREWQGDEKASKEMAQALRDLFGHFVQARLWCDLRDGTSLELTEVFTSSSERDAKTSLRALEALTALWHAELQKTDNVTVKGEFRLDGKKVRGSFVMQGIHTPVERASHRMIRSR